MKIESHWVATPTTSLTLSALRFHHRQLQPPSRDLVRAVEANVALQMMLAATHVAVTDSFNFNFARVVIPKGRTLQTILAIAQVASFALNLDEVRKSLAAFLALGHGASMMQGDGFEPP